MQQMQGSSLAKLQVLTLLYLLYPSTLQANAGFFVDSGQLLGGSQSYDTGLADLDGDGDLDAFVANYFQEPNRVWLNDGDGFFTDSGQELGSAWSSRVALGDLDGDGDLDAFVANSNGHASRVWLNIGGAVFVAGQGLADGYDNKAVALGDLNGDGHLDAWIANYWSTTSTIWWNQGNGTFVDSGQYLPNDFGIGVALGDLNGDSHLDAFVTNWNSGLTSFPNTVWLNDGTGTFVDSGQLLGAYTSGAVALGDINADGHLDAYVANSGVSPRSDRLWLNDGTGMFTDSGQILDGAFNVAVSMGDLDGDNDLDVFTGNYSAPNMHNHVWLNQTGAFVSNGQSLGTLRSRSVPLGDLDGDGDLDVFVANWGSHPNKVWFNIPFDPATEPNLFVPGDIPAAVGEVVQVPVELRSHGRDTAGLAFSLDYDPACLFFDPADVDGNGLPDAIQPLGSYDFFTAFFDLSDDDGEIDIALANFPPASLADGTIATVEFTTTCIPPSGASLRTPIRFSADPAASFSDLAGQSISGTSVGGNVEIIPGLRGDCNGDGVLGAADLVSCYLEVFDGDSDHWLDTPGGTFSGSPVGCDANADQIVDAGDLSCKPRLIFGLDCAEADALSHLEGGPELRLPASLRVSRSGALVVPIRFRSRGHDINSLVFSLDLDESRVRFDRSDRNHDGIPDAVKVIGLQDFVTSIDFAAGDRMGEIDIFITDPTLSQQTLPDGVLFRIELQASEGGSILERGIRFSRQPKASFGSIQGQSIPGSAELERPRR